MGMRTSTNEPNEQTQVDNTQEPQVSDKGEPSGEPSSKENDSEGNPATPPAEEWKPNFKFTALGKEKEMDEFIKPILTKENEKRIRELYEKSEALDDLKNQKTSRDNELKHYKETVEPAYNQVLSNIEYLDKLKQQDLHSFFTKIGLNEETVLKYALDRIKYKDMTPEQRAEYDQNSQARTRLVDMERQSASLQEQIAQASYTKRMQDLDLALTKPEVLEVVQALDARMGRVGVFRDECIKRGILHWQTSQRDISAEQAVQEVLALVGKPTMSAPTTQVIDGANGGPQSNKVILAGGDSKPTINTVKGGANSPAKKSIKSIDDIRKAAAAMPE